MKITVYRQWQEIASVDYPHSLEAAQNLARCMVANAWKDNPVKVAHSISRLNKNGCSITCGTTGALLMHSIIRNDDGSAPANRWLSPRAPENAEGKPTEGRL